MPSYDKHNEPPISELLHAFYERVRGFLSIRLHLAVVEFSEKTTTIKSLVAAGLSGVVLMFTAWFFLSAMAAAVLAELMGHSNAAWIGGIAIVGTGQLVLGGACISYVVLVLRSGRLWPQRTLRVLKQDWEWVQKDKEKRS